MQERSEPGESAPTAASDTVGMAQRVAAFDWSTTPLGPQQDWPATLRTAVGICLSCELPVFVWWGPRLVNIYNDAYAPVLGKRHPDALGKPAAEVWSDIWPQIGADVRRVVKDGVAITKERVRFVMERNGYAEETFFTYSHSPIPDGHGGIGGLFQVCFDETAGVRNERERELLTEHRRLALHAANMGWWHYDPVTRIARYDRRFTEIFNVTGSERPNDEILKRLHPADLPGVWSQVQAALDPKNPRPYATEYRIIMDDGSIRWVEAHGLAQFEGEGAARRATDFVGTVADITNRKLSAEQSKTILESISDAFYAVDSQFRFTYVNRHAEELWRRSRDELIGQSIWEAFPHAMQTASYPEHLRAMADRTPVRYETHSAILGRWVEVNIYPDAGGGLSCYFTDIDKRRAAQEALERSEARFRFLSDLSERTRNLDDPESVMAAVARALGQHLAVSRCAYADVDADSEHFIIRHDYTDGCASTVGEYRLSLFGNVAATAQREGRTLVMRDVDAEAPDGAGMFSHIGIKAIVCCPLVKSGRLVAMMAVHQTAPRDWTDDEISLVEAVVERSWAYIERARATRERERLLAAEQAARADAERVGRMKDEFLATLSHELRTPLTAITGWAGILTQPGITKDDLREGLEIIQRNARAQTQIIEDLLDMSRIINGAVRLDVQRVSLGTILAAAAQTVKPAADAKRITLSVHASPTGDAVNGDPARLQQVFWNLLSNSVKFTPVGGRVEVSVRMDGTRLQAVVSDTGEGIAPDFMPHVFDRFRQADASTTRRHGGLGLGLAIVKHLVELHGGTVHAESDGVGKGSTFVVSLPHCAPLPVQDAPPAPERTTLTSADPDVRQQLQGVRVLLVDDEPDTRVVVSRLLQEAAASVRTAGSADEAFKLLQDDLPDVIVSDIGMPGEDGYSLIRRIRAMGGGGDLPAVALTAYARSDDRRRAAVAGFDTHVAKPVEPAELRAVIARLARRGRA